MDLLPKAEVVEAPTAYWDQLRDEIAGCGKREAFLRSDKCLQHRLAVARRPVFLLEGEIRWVTEFIGEPEAR